MDRHSILVIVNPTSRNVPRRPQLEEDLEPLRREGHTFRVEITSSPGDATRIAADAVGSEITRVAALGGDGTLNEVINGVTPGGPVVGVLPGGTGNVWAKEVRIPRDIPKASRILVEAPVRRLDLGNANGRKYLLMCGIGLDGAVTAAVPNDLKKRLGSTSYILIGLRRLMGFKAIEGIFELDGEVVEGPFYLAVVGNSRSYGGVINITRRAFVDDGLLDVCVFGGRSLPRLARHGLRIALGTHASAHDILYRRVSRFAFRQPGVAMQLDGDAFGETPVEIEVAPAAVRMVLPAGSGPFAHPPL